MVGFCPGQSNLQKVWIWAADVSNVSQIKTRPATVKILKNRKNAGSRINLSWSNLHKPKLICQNVQFFSYDKNIFFLFFRSACEKKRFLWRKPVISSYEPRVDKIKKYNFIIQPKHCGKNVRLLIGIKSLVGSKERRAQIRSGWGNEKYFKKFKVKRVFLFGRGEEFYLKQEAENFDDILMGDFRESFYNLTFKDSMFFTWAVNSCTKTQFVFKGSDFKPQKARQTILKKFARSAHLLT